MKARALAIAVLASVAWLVCSPTPMVTLAAPVPVLLDTDIGDDFDDMFALTYLASRPDLYSIEGIIVSTFNTTKRAMMVAYSLDRFWPGTSAGQHPLIVVGVSGQDTSPMYQFSYVPHNYSLSEYQSRGGTIVEDGVDWLVSFVEQWDIGTSGPLHYVEIAPVSTLAAAINQIPAASLAKLRVFAMSGSIARGYSGIPPPDAEYNVVVDVLSSQILYSYSSEFYTGDGGAGMVTAPLDTTVFQQWNGPLWQQFLAFNDSKHPFVSTVLDAYTHWYDAGGRNNGAPKKFSPAIGTSIMYDPQAAYSVLHSVTGGKDCAFADQHLVYACVPLSVNDTGYTVIDKSRGSLISAAVGFYGDAYNATRAIGAEILMSITYGQAKLSQRAVDKSANSPAALTE